MVELSLPAWTPGVYEMRNFARNVFEFAAVSDTRALRWNKIDPDTWRIEVQDDSRVRVAFSFMADSLDTAMAWSRPDFLLVNGTNIFLYPEHQSLDYPATVTVRTERDWRIATAMRSTDYGEWGESSYHDLVDMPFFIGVFDLDSVRIGGQWTRLASYPAGTLAGDDRKAFRAAIERMMPAQVAVFGTMPWTTYTTMLIFDLSSPGGSALEHASSHVGIYSPSVIGTLLLPLMTAHELFHAWNVKRLRPAGLTPYRYDRPQPTRWLWMSEGITDYYADLTLVRSGIVPPDLLWTLTNNKIASVEQVPPVALDDASLSVWIRPRDGTENVYHRKGSLAGLVLDILIRDASDNRASLDTVMRELYEMIDRQTGFDDEDWWNAVSRAARGFDAESFRRRFTSGREPLPWAGMAPLAGLRFTTDTTRDARVGVQVAQDTDGIRVLSVLPGTMAEEAGLRAGDRITGIGDVAVRDLGFGNDYRLRYADGAEGTPIPIAILRNGRYLELRGRLRFRVRVQGRMEPDTSASGKALRIREGILTGRVDSR
jgi:predicted metalloprotease with PDZ domain